MKYPIGIQTFESIRTGGWTYVDKTRFILPLVNEYKYVFLGRPRRFGKSLLLSTLEAYFQGRKDLFEGLEISKSETEWKEYPVLRFDFSGAEADSPEFLTDFIKNELRRYEEAFGLEINDSVLSAGNRFGLLIENLSKKTGKEVVVLVDEYDKGLIETILDKEKLQASQKILRSFYAQLKMQDKYLRFGFLTGVARFHHLTIFSGLNNLKDISLSPRFSDVCGITEAELESTFKVGIESLAETNGFSYDEALESLRKKYDSYRFSAADSLVYNPFSILNCLESGQLENYWLSTGTPQVFMNYLEKSHFDISDIEDAWADAETLASQFNEEDPIPLLYQTGYLTIKEFKKGFYRLGIPNGEVRSALLDYLMPNFMGINSKREKNLLLLDFADKADNGNAEGLIKSLQDLISKIPYHEFEWENKEKTYHLIVYIISLMAGIDSRCEISTSGGRIDMVMQTKRFVYVLEFKLDGTPEEALRQIDEKGYAAPWQNDNRTVYKIGISFSSANRNISSYKIERV